MKLIALGAHAEGCVEVEVAGRAGLHPVVAAAEEVDAAEFQAKPTADGHGLRLRFEGQAYRLGGKQEPDRDKRGKEDGDGNHLRPAGPESRSGNFLPGPVADRTDDRFAHVRTGCLIVLTHRQNVSSQRISTGAMFGRTRMLSRTSRQPSRLPMMV